MRNKTISAITLVAMTSLSMVNAPAVYGEELVDNSFIESTINETSTTGLEVMVNRKYTGNSTQVGKDDTFKPIVHITVSGSSIKKIVQDSIQLPSNTIESQSQISGIKDLKGQIELELNTPGYTMLLPESGTIASSSNVIGTPSFSGTKCTIPVNWGQLFESPYKTSVLSSFKNDEEFSDLDIEVKWNATRFREVFSKPTDITLTAKAKCSINGNLSSKLVVNTYNQVWQNYELTEVNRPFSINDDKSLSPSDDSHTIEIVKKPQNQIVLNPNRPSNKPNNTTSSSSSQEKTSKVIRMYNPNSGEHLFTLSDAERINLITYGWKSEKCDWWVPVKSDTPIYRLYNSNNGDHHYTTNAGERDVLVELGWSYEGPALYSADEDGIPIYRMYNPNAKGAGSHHYTESIEECDALRGFGWNFEGIAWYGLAD